MAEFAEPEIEIVIWVQARDGLAEKAFQPAEKVIDFGQLLAGIGKKILEIEIGIGLPHKDSQCRAVPAAGKPEDVLFAHDATTRFGLAAWSSTV